MASEVSDLRSDGERKSAGQADFSPPPIPEPHDESRPGSEAVAHLGRLFAELKDLIGYYLAAKADSIRSAAIRVAIFAALGFVGAIAAAVLLCTACVLLLSGAADALSRLLHAGPWAGELIVAGLVLGGTAGGALLFLRKFRAKSLKKTVESYERRQHSQRTRFGQSVADRAESAGHKRG